MGVPACPLHTDATAAAMITKNEWWLSGDLYGGEDGSIDIDFPLQDGDTTVTLWGPDSPMAWPEGKVNPVWV